MSARGLGVALVIAGAAGCAGEGELAVPAPDPAAFRATAYPILLADCGFPACHGDPRRFFAIYGPGRTRLSEATPPYDPATPDELAQSYARAVSMLRSPDGLRRAPLLRKPLAPAAGGAGHRGDDAWGASVYPSKTDPRFAAVFFWATSGGAQ